MTQTVFITGTSSGIGHATVLYFAQKGWNVAATMRTPSKAAGFDQFPNIKVYPLDVTDCQSIYKAIESAIHDFGNIDVVVNNAGYGLDGVFEAMTDEDIKKQFETNVFGLMRVSKAFISHFRNKKKGTIIQVASMGGRLAFPLYSVYHATKWAVEGFTEALQFELKPFGIQTRIIEPGAIKTEFYGGSRHFVQPKDTSDYKNFVDQCEKVSMEAGEKGESPQIVAATIFKAATSNSNKLRWPVGNPAPMLLTLRKFIPDSWWFAVVRMSYKIK